MLEVEKILGQAVKHFWETRARQQKAQGTKTGKKDIGNRPSALATKHADGFIQLLAAIVQDAGLSGTEIAFKEKRTRTLPGFFRPSKEWDIVIYHKGELVAVIEVKSIASSFGNNLNNRVEEALGSATDFWAAYKAGAFHPSQQPWLGYLFMMVEDPISLRPRRTIKLSPYEVDLAFQTKSYMDGYQETCRRLIRERLYDACCFFSSSREMGSKGKYSEPDLELGIRSFAVSLHARVSAFASIKRGSHGPSR